MKVFKDQNERQPSFNDEVTRQEASARLPQHLCPSNGEEEDVSDVFEHFENFKNAAQTKYRRPGSSSSKKRFNKKEARMRSRAQKTVPHGNDPPGFEKYLLNQIAESDPLDPPTDKGDFFSFLRDLKLPDDLLTDDVNFWMSQMENMALLAYHMSIADSLTGITMAIFSYIKTVTKKSCIIELGKIIDELVKTTPLTADDYEPHAWSGRDTLDAWSLFKSNTNFKRVSYLISAAMSMSVCTMKEIEWSPFGLQLISVKALEEQAKAVDVLDALLNTFVWCAETGWRVFETRSLKPLLYSDQSIQEYTTAVDWIVAHKDQALIGTLPDLGAFEKKVDDALKRTGELKSVQKTGPTAFWLQTKYSELVDIKFKLVCKHKNAAMKFSPLGVAVTGTTGVGKSTLMKILMKSGLLAMGFEYDASRIITHAKGDDFDSTLTSDTLGIYYDDFGHGKPKFEKNSPVDEAIRILNNVACQAVKAELNQKGVVFVNAKAYVVSSNHTDLNVGEYTDIPSAALRRFIMVRAEVKPEFCRQGTTMLNTDHPSLRNGNVIPDVWNLTIDECTPFTTKKGSSYRWKTHISNGVPIKNVGMDVFLDAYVLLARKHGELQRHVLQATSLFEKADFCSTCCKPSCYCSCPPVDNEELDAKTVQPHMLENINDLIVDVGKKAATNYVKSWFSPFTMWNGLLGYYPIRKLTTRALVREMETVLDESVTPFLISVTPDFVFNSNSFQRLVSFWQRSKASKNRNYWLLYQISSILSVANLSAIPFLAYRRRCHYRATGHMSPWNPLLWASAGLCFSSASLFVLHAFREARFKRIRASYLERRDALSDHWKELRANTVLQGAVAGATIIIGVKLLKMWNAQRIEAQATENKPGWFGYMMNKLGIETKTQTETTTPIQVVETLKKSNVYWAHFKRSETSTPSCNIFFPRKNVAVFPRHMFCDLEKKTLDPAYTSLEITVFRGKTAGDKFTFKVDMSNCVFHPTLDIAYAFVPNCPDLRDKTKFLPLTQPQGMCIAEFIGNNRDGFFQERVSAISGKYGHMLQPGMPGFTYKTNNAQFGSCMAPLISLAKDPCIIGFHIGGCGNDGVCLTLLLSDHEYMIAELEKKPGVLISAHATELPKIIMGRTVLDSDKVHPHSMAAKLTCDHYVEILGSTKLRTQQKSNVQPSILSPIIEKVTGIPNQWGQPKLLPNWKGFNATLEHIVNPSDMFAPKELDRAKEDWIAPLREKVISYSKVDIFRPLTEKESILGVDGKQFLEPMKMSTSMGFPIFGKKSKHFDEIRDGECLLDRRPTELVSVEVTRLLECWKSGNRAYPVTSATLKDEPTPLESEKVRVFQAGNVAMTMLIRKYFLPLIRFFGLNPTVSEMAVGMNAFGKDWDVLTTHWETHGVTRAFGWDYSKYDVRMNSQITTAVYASLIELAKIGGYPPDALIIMKNMVADIVHPLIDYNGTLMLSYNMNTSGNPITVQVNNIANSFYVRLGFFSLYPDVCDFRSAVAVIFYGDDCIGTVVEKCNNFNFVTYRDFLARHKIKITPPDKGDSVKPFLSLENCEFIKRTSQFIPEINTRIGKLVEDSIFKSLHSNLASKAATKEQVAISCLETAAHEWFAHGREVYELRTSQLQEVCREANLPVPAVFTSFDDRVEHWKQKYSSE